MGIPKSFIDDVLQRSSIVQVIGKHVRLKKGGKDYQGLCPFHKEKTPSFSVSEDKQVYYCHGCGAKGNLLQFMMEHERYQYTEAITQLAHSLGMTVPRDTQPHSEGPSETEKIYPILEKACAWYQKQLSTHPEHRLVADYLRERGVSETSARNFSLGYAPPDKNQLPHALHGQDGQNTELLRLAGLIKASEHPNESWHEVFLNRLMFPIRDTRGRVIGFGGRSLSERQKAKYLNSPETPVFHKRRHLYGLYEALQASREHPYMLIVEGYMDVLICHQHEFKHTVASLGTAVGTEQLELAFRYTSKVIFCFDGDNAGRKAALRVLEPAMKSMRDEREMFFLFMPEGDDPDSLLRSQGSTAMYTMLEQAQSLSEVLLAHLIQDLDLTRIEGRARLKAEACRYLNLLEHCAFKDLLIQELARYMQTDVHSLRALLQDTAATAHSTTDYSVSADQLSNNGNVHDTVLTSLPRQLLSILLYDPQLMPEYCDELLPLLQEWHYPDTITKPLMGMLNYLKASPQTGIHDALAHYQKHYPKHLSADELLATVHAVVRAETTQEQQQKVCRQWIQEIIDSVRARPEELARRDRLRTALRRSQDMHL